MPPRRSRSRVAIHFCARWLPSLRRHREIGPGVGYRVARDVQKDISIRRSRRQRRHREVSTLAAAHFTSADRDASRLISTVAYSRDVILQKPRFKRLRSASRHLQSVIPSSKISSAFSCTLRMCERRSQPSSKNLLSAIVPMGFTMLSRRICKAFFSPPQPRLQKASFQLAKRKNDCRERKDDQEGGDEL